MLLDATRMLTGVEVRPSTIDGAGVFAKRAIKNGEYICSYDGSTKAPENFQEFCYSLRSPDGIWKVGDPHHLSDVGHIINDGACFRLNESLRDDIGVFRLSSPRVTNAVNQYLRSSQEKANVRFVDSSFCLYAVRDLVAGEELFYPYGIDYWVNLIRLQTYEILTRAFCMQLSGSVKVNEADLLTLDSGLETYKVVDDYEHLRSLLRFQSHGQFAKALGLIGLSSKEQCMAVMKLVK
jgi:hypothetical protein